MIGRFARNRSEEQEPEEQEREHVRREPLPLSRAILWKPLPDSYHLLASMMRAPERKASLFITQRSFLQVERHLRSGPDLELGGFLAGQLYECPQTRARYAVVNTVVPFADVREEAIGSRVTQEAFDSVQKRLRRHELSLIGWYRNGNGLGLQLLPDDVETHMTYFVEPWQTTMIVIQTSSKSKGAFFTYDSRVGRSYCIPFYELFDPRAAEAKRVNRTCVSWPTYVAADAVQPLPAAEKEIVEATVAPIRPEPPPPEPPEPLDEWWEAIKEPWVKLRDVAVRPPRENEPPSLDWEPEPQTSEAAARRVEPQIVQIPLHERKAPNESMPASPGAQSERAEASPVSPDVRPIEVPSPAPVVQRADARKSEVVRAVPPFAGPARPEARAERPLPVPTPSAPTPISPSQSAPAAMAAPAPAVRPPEVPTPSAVATPSSLSTPSVVATPARMVASVKPGAQAGGRGVQHAIPVPPASTAPPRRRTPPSARPISPAKLEAMLTAVPAPAVALPREFHQDTLRWQRRGRIGLVFAATSFLAVIGLSTIRARTSGSAQTPPAAAGAAPIASTQLPAQSPAESTEPLNGNVILALPMAVDSLSGALSYYREIEADYRSGLVGCRVLDNAYQLVVKARTRVNSSRRHVAGALNAADSIRVSMLRAEYTHVAQTYRRSGCVG